jgi:maleate isomerase
MSPYFPYTLDTEQPPTFGLIVLSVDETLEDDFRRLIPPQVARLHITRIPSGAELTPETIAQMAHDLPTAAALLPKEAQFDAIAYACTSGTALIGADRVTELIKANATAAAVTTPLTAALTAIHHLGLQRVGIVSPYIASVAAPIRAAFQAAGIEVPATLSFGEEVEARVARITGQSIMQAAADLAQQAELDGIFLSCTNLRTLDIIDALEDSLGVPVLSSNQCLAWHMAQLAGIEGDLTQVGRLLSIAD